jgi:hypothetical protein
VARPSCWHNIELPGAGPTPPPAALAKTRLNPPPPPPPPQGAYNLDSGKLTRLLAAPPGAEVSGVFSNRIGDKVYISLTVQHPHEHLDEEAGAAGRSSAVMDKQRAWMVGGGVACRGFCWEGGLLARGTLPRAGPALSLCRTMSWHASPPARTPARLPAHISRPRLPPRPARQGYVGPFPSAILSDNVTLTFSPLPLLRGTAADTVRATTEACIEPRAAAPKPPLSYAAAAAAAAAGARKAVPPLVTSGAAAAPRAGGGLPAALLPLAAALPLMVI